MFGCRSHHKSNQHGLRPSRTSTLSSRQGRAECRRAYGNTSLLDPSASRQQVSLLEVRGRSRRRTRMPLRLRFRAEACYGHGLSTLSSWALSRRLQNSARGWMFRSNGLQENHISPQVDCRMCGPDRRHLGPVCSQCRAHRGAAAAHAFALGIAEFVHVALVHLALGNLPFRSRHADLSPCTQRAGLEAMPVVAKHAGRLSGVVNSAQPAWIALGTPGYPPGRPGRNCQRIKPSCRFVRRTRLRFH